MKLRRSRAKIIAFLHAMADRAETFPRVNVYEGTRAHKAYMTMSANAPWRGGPGRRWRERSARLHHEAASLVASNRIRFGDLNS